MVVRIKVGSAISLDGENHAGRRATDKVKREVKESALIGSMQLRSVTGLLCVFTALALTSCDALVDNGVEIGASAAAASNFEVVPPAYGGPSEIEHRDQITENDGVISAATPQDAANAAVERLIAIGSGVTQIQVGSGIGYVAMGQAVFDDTMTNLVAARIAKRNATLKAYLDAQRKLGEFFEGANVETERLITQYSSNLDTAEASAFNSESRLSDKVVIAVNAYISGFVLYDVAYQANEVFVTIVVTPATIRGHTAHAASKITLKEAKNAEAGISYVKNNISKMLENNIIFPLGGKQVYIRPTQEFAFLGFATEPIRVNSNWSENQNRRQKELAITRAGSSARQSLLTMVQGNSIQYVASDVNITSEEFRQFDGQEIGISLFDKAKQSYFAEQNTNEELRVAVSGNLPSGVQLDSYFYDDNNDGIDDWAFAIAIYIPTVPVQVKDAGTAATPNAEEHSP